MFMFKYDNMVIVISNKSFPLTVRNNLIRYICRVMVVVIVFNTTFNNISAIWWRSVLLVKKTGVPSKNHRQTLSHNTASSTPRLSGIHNSQRSGDRQ